MFSRRLLLTAFVAVAVCVLAWSGLHSSRSIQLRAARLQLTGNPAATLELATASLQRRPDDPDWLELAAIAAERTSDRVTAAGHLQRLHSVRPLPTDQLLKLARLLSQSASLITAESLLREVLRTDPDSEPANRQLANLLLAQCRRHDSQQPLRKLVELRSFLLDELAMLGSRDELLHDEPLIQAALQTSSRPLAVMAKASLALFQGNPRDALAFLQSTELPPVGQSEFVSLAARAFIAVDDEASLARWAESHATLLNHHPDGAAALGWLAWREGRPAAARDHLLQAIRLDHNHRSALQMLGSIFVSAGQTTLAKPLLDRVQQLHSLELLLHRVLEDDQTAPQMLRIATALEQLDRREEAIAWYLALAGMHPAEAISARQHAAQLELLSQQSADAGILPPFLPPQVAVVTLPERQARAVPLPVGAAETPAAPGVLPRFEDHGERLGLQQPWFFGQSTSQPRSLSVLQGFGGGLAVLDFDNDTWPDLLIVQGNSLPPAPDPHSADLLYRNLRAGVAQPVASVALPADSDYGQGAAAGDVNEDGFPDLFVGSTTGSRLLLNNGDGTFSDCSDSSLPPATGWTTSCAIADVTGDAVADLVELHYGEGTEIQTKLCSSGAARLQRSCRPDLFPGAADRLLTGDGRGGFTAAGPDLWPADDGRGLGVVIGDLDDTGRNSLFITNDMTPNAFRVPEVSADGRVLALPDVASIRGCAVNASGRIQAGMGIAAGDLNSDGTCDFFVTNFLAETNTLYAGTGGGFFQDLSTSTAADSGSLDLLSFGAQATDANLDGLPDLFVLNGHVDDYQHFQLPWKMRPAAWVATAPGRFTRVAEEVFGVYGSQPALGRALAQLDWNRDGRTDLVATFLDRPPAVYINESPTVALPLRIRPLGHHSCRRPIGGVLTLHSAPAGGLPPQKYWVTAGDGYYCSSEPVAAFARPTVRCEIGLTIRWPGGRTQQISVTTDDREMFVLEDRRQLYGVPE
ncbi:MAG: FG-GAP-like repeat-containing protein [Planctomycetota bacterium]